MYNFFFKHSESLNGDVKLLQYDQSVTKESQKISTENMRQGNKTSVAGFHTNIIHNDRDVMTNYEIIYFFTDAS